MQPTLFLRQSPRDRLQRLPALVVSGQKVRALSGGGTPVVVGVRRPGVFGDVRYLFWCVVFWWRVVFGWCLVVFGGVRCVVFWCGVLVCSVLVVFGVCGVRFFGVWLF